MSKPPTLLGKDVPFVQAAHYEGKQRPTAILLRTSWTTGDKGAAYGIAKAWHHSYNKVESCHYVVDEKVTIQCLPDKVVAIPFKPSLAGAITINVCYNPPEPPTDQVVERTARLTARLCALYKIPLRILDDQEERAWMKHKWRYRGGILLRTIEPYPSHNFFVSAKIAYSEL